MPCTCPQCTVHHRPLPARECELCGATFHPRDGRHKYCDACKREYPSPKLRHDRRRRRQPLQVEVCRKCGVSFETRDRRRRYCDKHLNVNNHRGRAQLAYELGLLAAASTDQEPQLSVV